MFEKPPLLVKREVLLPWPKYSQAAVSGE